MKNNIKKFFFLSFSFFFSFYSFSQSHNSTQAHQGLVTKISSLNKNDSFSVFSAGEDGFLIKWKNDGMGEHYQISDLPIKMIAQSPNGNEIAVYESDGASLNRVSVWNWNNFTRKFAFRFNDTLTSLCYSAKGTYIICGTVSVNGAFFLNPTNGNVIRNKVKENTGLVNFIQTSNSENSVTMYSPKGSLSYYNLKNGEKKASFNTEFNLSQFGLFNNNVFGAGVRGNNIFIIQAVTGATLASYSVTNPVLITSNSSKDLFYIVNENRQFKLYKIANDRNKAVIEPHLIRTFSGLKSNESIVCASLTGEEIYAGSSSGNIFKFDYAESERVDVEQALTERNFEKIYDISNTSGDDFYLLTQSALFKANYDNGSVVKLASNSGYTNLLTYGENLLLWSKDSKKSVVMMDLQSGNISQLFSPAGTIQSLKIFGNIVIDVESNSFVNKFDISSGAKSQIYRGSSIQDAILFNENDLYVAKSSSSSPNVSLLYVNMKTQETVPLSMKGNVAYSLTYDAEKKSQEFYGLTIYTDSKTKRLTTSVFAYNPSSKSYRYLLSIGDEDSEAATNLFNGILYTNIGKSQVRSYNLANRKTFLYKRSASMPVKSVSNHNRMVVLNRDGSISWYNPTLNSVLADWYITSDGNRFEF